MENFGIKSFYWLMVLLSVIILIVSSQLVTENILMKNILYFGSIISASLFIYLIECENKK